MKNLILNVMFTRIICMLVLYADARINRFYCVQQTTHILNEWHNENVTHFYIFSIIRFDGILILAPIGVQKCI